MFYLAPSTSTMPSRHAWQAISHCHCSVPLYPLNNKETTSSSLEGWRWLKMRMNLGSLECSQALQWRQRHQQGLSGMAG